MSYKKIYISGQVFDLRFLTFAYPILKLIEKEYSKKQITQTLGMSKQAIDYRIQRLIAKGIINTKTKTTTIFYGLNQIGYDIISQGQGLSGRVESKKPLKEHLLKTKKPRVHKLSIKLPIVLMNENANFTKELAYRPINEMKNWQGHSFFLPFVKSDIDITTKNIIIKVAPFHTSKTDYMAEMNNHLEKVTNYVDTYLRTKYKVLVDVYKKEYIDHETAIQDEGLEETQDKHSVKKVFLGYKARIDNQEMNQEAWAKIDNSLDEPEFESNDQPLVDSIIKLPERITNIEKMYAQDRQLIHEFTNQIKLHLEVERRKLEIEERNIKLQEEMQHTLKDIRDSLKR